jgi:protein SCO1/2
MPKGLMVMIGVLAVVLFLGSGALLIVAASRMGSGGSLTGGPGASGTSGMSGMGSGPSSAESGATGDPLSPDPKLSDLAILPFELTDLHGERVTNDVFAGKLTVVDFFFTHCQLVCPTLSSQMARIAGTVNDPKLGLLSISIDPGHDTPERLEEYAGNFVPDPRWRFVRGEKDAVWKLVHDGMKFAIADDASMPITLPDGSTMANIRHPAHLILVGPGGEVLGLYMGTHDEDVGALIARLKKGLAELK